MPSAPFRLTASMWCQDPPHRGGHVVGLRQPIVVDCHVLVGVLDLDEVALETPEADANLPCTTTGMHSLKIARLAVVVDRNLAPLKAITKSVSPPSSTTVPCSTTPCSRSADRRRT